MAVIYPFFLQSILQVHTNIQLQVTYPFFDPACTCYEALRSIAVDGLSVQSVLKRFGLTEYGLSKSQSSFRKHGTAGLIGLDARQFVEDLPLEVERMVFVLKQARAWIPATKMVILLKGFNHDVNLALMRHLYASYGWALGTREYKEVNFYSLNLKVQKLCQIRAQHNEEAASFFRSDDILQKRLEIFRTLGERGITKRYFGSRVTFKQHKQNFLQIGLLGLVDCARSPFRNSKLGFKEEGRIVLAKIQQTEKDAAHFLKVLRFKKIEVGATCLINVFTRWKVDTFQSQFKGDLERLLRSEDTDVGGKLPAVAAGFFRMDENFISLVKEMAFQPLHLATPGIFLFLPYLNRLKIFEKASSLMNLDPDCGYSWFSLLLCNLGRILGGISSAYKACRINELSIPIASGLVAMPSKDSLLNGLAAIEETHLLEMRKYLTQISSRCGLVEGKSIAFDFKMRDFTGDDVPLKNIGKAPSPKRKICFPGFRPHIAWDLETGAPIAIEFRNGRARATTTIKRFVRELLSQSLGTSQVERVYLDSEYTAEHVWKFIVDNQEGLGADLTMCVKQNKRVKKFINDFLETNPTWIYFDEDHTFTEETFEIPIQQTDKILRCVLKRKEKNGRLRCFGSTISLLDSQEILQEYRKRWIIENGIKDLVENYFFDKIPGIEPHRIDTHYFIVTLARVLYEMFCQDYEDIHNPDSTQKTLGTLRPEFIVGANAMLYREGDVLIIEWKDYYPEKQHEILTKLFEKLNCLGNEKLPFLGGLKLRYKIGPPREEKLRNKLNREVLEF